MGMGEVTIAKEANVNPINAKGSARSRGFELTGSSKGHAEFTDAPKDFYLPKGVRGRIDGILESVRSYNEFKAYLQKQGIKLSTDLEKLEKEEADNKELRAVRETMQKIAVALETYKETFGKDSAKALKEIVLYSNETSGQASFTTILKGEKDDGKGGRLLISDWFRSGHDILHEFAHVLQGSKVRKGEDLLDAAARMNRDAALPSHKRAYFGANPAHREAERMADAIADGFYNGDKESIEFIKRLRKIVK